MGSWRMQHTESHYYIFTKCKIELQVFLLFSQDIIILALSSGHIQILHLANKYKLRNMPQFAVITVHFL